MRIKRNDNGTKFVTLLAGKERDERKLEKKRKKKENQRVGV